MTADTLRKLYSRLTGSSAQVSPHRTTDIISEAKITEDIADVRANLHPSVSRIFTSNTKRPKIDVIGTFDKGVKRLLEQGFTVGQLIQMDDSCVNKQGGIDVERLLSRLKSEDPD